MKGERWVLCIAMLLPTVAAAVYFVGLSSHASGTAANPFLQWAYALSKLVQFLLPVAWLAAAEPAQLRIRRISFRGLPAGIVFGIGAGLFIFMVYHDWLAGSTLFNGVAARIQSKLSEFGAGTPAAYLTLAAFLCIVHSLLEEYYWRWFVYGRLRRHVHRRAALIVAGLAFMAHHVVIIWVYFPGQFSRAVLPFSLAVAVGGIVWAWLYERTGSLIGPWASHFIVDAALMAVGYELVFGAK